MKTSPPNMTREHAAECRRLRKEEQRLLKADSARERLLLTQIARIDKRAALACLKLEQKYLKAARALEKAAAKETRPLQREWTRRTEGRVKHERLDAVRHRIAVLEGRMTS